MTFGIGFGTLVRLTAGQPQRHGEIARVSRSEPDVHPAVVPAVVPALVPLVAATNLRRSLAGQLGSSGLEEGKVFGPVFPPRSRLDKIRLSREPTRTVVPIERAGGWARTVHLAEHSRESDLATATPQLVTDPSSGSTTCAKPWSEHGPTSPVSQWVPPDGVATGTTSPA